MRGSPGPFRAALGADEAFVANTDHAGFDDLAGVSRFALLDEVNFRQPSGLGPMKRRPPGAPVFFRLKGSRAAIGGHGFSGCFQVLSLDLA